MSIDPLCDNQSAAAATKAVVVLNMVTSAGFPTAMPMPPVILRGEGHGAMVRVDPAVLEGVVEAHAGGAVELLVEDGGGDARE